MPFERSGRNGEPYIDSAVLAEDLKLTEFILTKGEDRSKRKGGDDKISVGGEPLSEENIDDNTEKDYEESEEERAMIMNKGIKINYRGHARSGLSIWGFLGRLSPALLALSLQSIKVLYKRGGNP